MRRPWLRSPLPLALAVTLASIAVGLVLALPLGGYDGQSASDVMLTILKYGTAELFVLWGVFWLVKRARATSTTTTP